MKMWGKNTSWRYISLDYRVMCPVKNKDVARRFFFHVHAAQGQGPPTPGSTICQTVLNIYLSLSLSTHILTLQPYMSIKKHVLYFTAFLYLYLASQSYWVYAPGALGFIMEEGCCPSCGKSRRSSSRWRESSNDCNSPVSQSSCSSQIAG